MVTETKPESEAEHWMKSKWRPAMGWMYMVVSTCDFMLFPVLWSVLQATVHGAVNTQWQPITLQGAGLFHLAMGAVLGIAAYGRTQEKLTGTNNAQTATPGFQTRATTSGVFQTTRVPSPTIPSGFNGTSASDFYQPQTRVGFGGKLAPEQPPYPQL
jgi:hypothetical protein